MKMMTFILLIQRFSLLFAQYIIGMNEESQIQTYSLELNLKDYELDSYLTYGLWSRYAPLGTIAQVGPFGVLDSNCFHLHNAVQQSTNDLNLIVYDCINYETQTIIRRIQFITIDDNWHLFEVQLDNLQYEYVWHYFEVSQWPLRNRFEFLVIQYPEIKLYIVQEDIQFPYKDTQLLLTFGGGFQIQENKSILLISQSNTNQILQEISKFSFFPGKFYLYPLSIDIMPITRNAAENALGLFEFRKNCQCNSNFQISLPEKVLSNLDNQIYISENPNCDSYLLSTWIRIQNIQQSSQDFLYQVLKLSSNFENPQLVNSNLAAFQLFYKFTPSKNQLIVKTYSFTFPIVSVNFDDNPYLITNEFDLEHNIKLWQNVFVILMICRFYELNNQNINNKNILFISTVLDNNQLKIQITFYEGLQTHEYQFEQLVNQFHVVKFKLQYGNVQQLVYDTLSVKFVTFIFQNCLNFIILPELICDQSCLQCDGPTSSDCLTCSEDSNRIYIAEQKSCICPYYRVEDTICKDYSDYQFVLVKDDIQDSKCMPGYFQSEGNFHHQQVVQCVLKRNKEDFQRYSFHIKISLQSNYTTITCLECVYQPQTWATNSYCYTNLYTDNYGSVSKFLQTPQQYYIFDGDNLQIRFYPKSQVINEEIEDDFEYASMNFKNFCFQTSSTSSTWRSEKECYQCDLSGCLHCQITALTTICLSCDYFFELKDGTCVYKSQDGQMAFNKCLAPYYQTSTLQCKLCNIIKCKYCFEYLSNDLKKCTLYRNFQYFEIGEYHQVGCALCEDDFIFDFTLGICKYEKPKIVNCIRSFINLEGLEICTLSKIDDFNVAPEIINCQKYITNCKQCLQTPQNILRCILCEDNYTASITSGQCYKCSINNGKICIEGDYQQKDEWRQIIQSFLLSFLPDKYMYPKSENWRLIIELPFECQPGFKPDTYSHCIKYCDSNCLSCALSDEFPYYFYCIECPLDYSKLPIRSSEQGKCIQCPQLCQVCKYRTEQEIKMINPNFIVTADTINYTFKCLQKVPDDNIVIDPYTNIAKYCYNSICTDIIQYQFDVDCQNAQDLISESQYYSYQNNININYCNKLGVQKIIIFVRISIEAGIICNLPERAEIKNDLQQKIYTLQEGQLKIEGEGRSAFFVPIFINNFRNVEIINMSLEVINVSYLKIDNDQSQINLVINNLMIFGRLNEVHQYSINSNKWGDLIIKDLIIINLNLLNSSLLDYISLNPESKISIQDLSIFNSNFSNSVLFVFQNLQQKIKITNIQIQNCQFYNSTLFSFNQISPNLLSQIDIEELYLTESIFIGSSLIVQSNEIQINLNNSQVYKNQITNSTLLDLSQNLLIQELWLINNIFINSLFASITEIEGLSKTVLIDNLYVKQNGFQTSSIINTKEYTNNGFSKLQFTTIYMKNNYNLQDSGLYLFNFNCYQIVIKDCLISNSTNLRHFNLFQIQSIIIQNVSYQNNLQSYKVPLSFECLNQKQQNPQLIYILGFSKLLIQTIRITNQLSIDYSFIHILSNILFSPNIKEVIEINDVIFQGNILLKQNLGIIVSQISIYSEKSQEMSLNNIHFQEDFFNEQNDDPSQTSAGLLFINSQQSSIVINNLTCQSNAVTNSSNSFIYINSNSVQIKNISIKNHNFLTELIWNKYYDLPLQNQNNSDQTIFIIQSIYKFLNKGGIISITSSNIIVTFGLFTQILSLSSSIFDIKTQGQGIVEFNSLSINQAEVDLLSQTEVQGSISIFSKNSLLNLKIWNVKFKNVFNRLSSSILSITPSLKYNKIDIHDVILENCLSLINQFMKIEFSQQKLDQNIVLIQNLSIYQSHIVWLEYFNKIDPISLSEINKVPIDNAIINLNECQLIIKGLIFEGTFISPILKISNFQKIQIEDLKINQAKTFYTFSIALAQKNLSEEILIMQQQQAKNFYVLSINWRIDKFNYYTKQQINYQITFFRVANIVSSQEKNTDIIDAI